MPETVPPMNRSTQSFTQRVPRSVRRTAIASVAALAGTGICWLPDYMCHDEIHARRLVRVLPDWAPPVGIVHAVFPSRRGLSPAVRHFLDFLGEDYDQDTNAVATCKIKLER